MEPWLIRRRCLASVLGVYEPDVVHDPVHVLEQLPGDVELAEAPQRRRQQRRPGFILEHPLAGDPRGGVHVRDHAAHHDVDVPDTLATEEAALPAAACALAQPALQPVRRVHHLLHPRGPLLLAPGPERPVPRRAHLLVEVCRPEPRHGALVRVGGEEGVAGGAEGLVDVLQDDLRLADGAAVVDEHGHGAVDGVAAEEEVALAAQVLLHVLVAHALEAQRQPHPRHERAPPVAQQRHLAAVSGHRRSQA
uniref:Uncharacterized protein n=1 Tax=Triticum urartu TaxID=4572 RepID=A0A8R7PLW8_TRIUA